VSTGPGVRRMNAQAGVSYALVDCSIASLFSHQALKPGKDAYPRVPAGRRWVFESLPHEALPCGRPLPAPPRSRRIPPPRECHPRDWHSPGRRTVRARIGVPAGATGTARSAGAPARPLCGWLPSALPSRMSGSGPKHRPARRQTTRRRTPTPKRRPISGFPVENIRLPHSHHRSARAPRNA
jgi:hypothetical protein